MDNKTVVLLDLNATLAVEYGLDTKNWTYDVTRDKYSQKLVDAMQAEGYEVHIVTARPEVYEADTLAKIEEDTGLVPFATCFKDKKNKFTAIHDLKSLYLDRLVQQGYDIDEIMALESNAKTRANYKKAGLDTVYTRAQFLARYAKKEKQKR